MSFRYKIALTIFALEAVVMLTVIWHSLTYLQNSLQQQIISSNQILLRSLVEHSAKEAVITEDFAHLQYELEQVADNSSIDEVLLLDFDDRVLASSDPSHLGQVFSTFSSDHDGSSDWIENEVSGSSGSLGRVAYRFSRQAIEDATLGALQFGFSLAIAGMLIVAAAGVMIGSILAKRLEKISRSTKYIEQGEIEHFELDESKDEVGELSRFIYRMATKLQEQLTQLQIGRERNRIALEVAGAGTWSWDINKRQLKWSAKYYQALGLLPDSKKPSYRLWLSRVHPEDRPRVENAVANMMRNNKDVDIEFRIIRPNGQIHWMHNVARFQFDHNDRPVEIFGLQIDITRYKKLALKNTSSA